MHVYNEEELGNAIKNEEDTIEIIGDLKKRSFESKLQEKLLGQSL